MLSNLVCKYRTRKALRWADRYTMPALSVTIAPYVGR